MPLASGQILHNRYRIVKLLGQGGFGAVYRAWDVNLKGPCAVKENFDTSPAAQAQFEREASLLFNLRHPNLPRVFDAFSLPGQGQYLVMDYIEGEDLGRMLERTGAPLTQQQALGWIAQVCDALSYMHSQNPPVIHRDLKPANIRITPQGQAMLVDFGIAKLYDPVLRTTMGARAVTPGYSPNEQYLSAGRTDARSDLYALGATLYTLFTCQTPPEAPERNMGATLPPIRSYNPAVSPQLEAAIFKAMEVAPDRRFQSAAEFKKALGGQQSAISGQPGVGIRIPPQQAAAPVPDPQSPITVTANQKSKISNLKLPLALVGLLALALLLWALWPKGSGTGELAATQTALAAIMERATEDARPTRTPRDTPTLTWTPGPTDTPTPTETATASATPTLTDTPPSFPGMILIPAGEFEMGNNDYSDEKPVHTVYLDAYYMDIYEVTNARYAECVNVGSCTAPPNTGHYANSSYADHPVVYVDWSQAQAFCRWAGGDLPTEAQWEKAARGGLAGKKYPWGDESPVCQKGAKNGAQSYSCSPQGTAAVGSFSPNGYGLYDMAGNVGEWALDWYQYTFYSSSPRENPTGPSSGKYRVLRGGSWGYDNVFKLRAADRGWVSPAYRDSYGGFRCVRSP